MTTDLSKYDPTQLPGADVLRRQRYAIIVADWNAEITYAMAQGARDTFLQHGVDERYDFAAIVVIGCVIQGDTPHFDYVCQSVTQGVAMLNAKGDTPVIFSVLTTLNRQQALDRCGGKLGNKGIEGAVTAIKMANL